RNTDGQGKATFPLLPAAGRREGEVCGFARGGRVASFSVRFQPLVVSAQRTQFTGGAEQHGVAGAPLAQPLLFEVRDTSGVPIAGQSVAFAVTGGEVAPASAQSDSSGAVEVRVTLGQRAGPVVVAGTVGPVTKNAIVYGDTGPPSVLGVWSASSRCLMSRGARYFGDRCSRAAPSPLVCGSSWERASAR